jgi:hypothetical protein
MNEIIKTYKRRTAISRVGYWKMRRIYRKDLICADEVILIADSKNKLQKAVTERDEILRGKAMMMMNAKMRKMI